METIITDLCKSKSKLQDQNILDNTEYSINLPHEKLHFEIIKKHSLVANHPPDGFMSSIKDLIQLDEESSTELAVVSVFQFYPRDEWELLLRNRLEKKRYDHLSRLLPKHDEPNRISITKADYFNINEIKTQLDIKSKLSSEDENQQIFALQLILNQILHQEGDSTIIMDICKENMPRILNESKDPTVIFLLLEIIIRLGVGNKNSRAVVLKLEQFCNEWPLKGRRLVDIFLDLIQPDNIAKDLRERIEVLKIERKEKIGNFPSLNDLFPHRDTSSQYYIAEDFPNHDYRQDIFEF